MHKDFFIHIITHKPKLFQAIVRFNTQAVPQTVPPVPESFSNLPQHTALALWQDILQNSNASQHFSVQHTQTSFWDFTENSRRLALVEPEFLAQTAQMFGAAIHADRIAQVIRNKDVLVLRQHVAPQVLHYAMQRGRFQLGTVATLFQPLDTLLPLQEQIILHGRLALRLCLKSWPDTLRTLCASWLNPILAAGQDNADQPHSLALEHAHDDTLLEHSRAIWFALKKILLKEVAPQWAPCFE